MHAACTHACMLGTQVLAGWLHGWMDGWMNGWMEGWMGRWMDGELDGLMDGWIDGWVGGYATTTNMLYTGITDPLWQFANNVGNSTCWQDALVGYAHLHQSCGIVHVHSRTLAPGHTRTCACTHTCNRLPFSSRLEFLLIAVIARRGRWCHVVRTHVHAPPHAL